MDVLSRQPLVGDLALLIMRRLLPLWIFGALLGLTACQVDTTVTINVTPDGSGVVEVAVALDEEALQAVGNLEDQLRLSDLTDAGWTIEGPEQAATGGTTRLYASKPFAVPERLPAVLRDIAGPGVFTDVALTRERSFARTSWALTGSVDLTTGLALFSDAELDATLSGLTLGHTEEEIRELTGCAEENCSAEDAFAFDLQVVLPETGATNGLMQDGVAHWELGLGEELAEPFTLSWTLEDRTPRMWRTVAAIAAALFVLVVVLQIVRLVMGRQAGPTLPRPSVPTRRAKKGTPLPVAEPQESGERTLELLVLGGVGVIWDVGTDPEGLLVPFVRQRGGVANPQEIAERYRAASLGHVSANDFWSSVGITGIEADLDAEYLSQVGIRSDVVPFLDRMKERNLQVACLTNAVFPWSVQLKNRFGLDDLIQHWVVSGEVGARKPSQAMFEALRRMTGVSFHNMLLIDSDSATLEAARGMGLSTVLLRGTALIPEGFPHPAIDGFAELFKPSTPAPPPESTPIEADVLPDEPPEESADS